MPNSAEKCRKVKSAFDWERKKERNLLRDVEGVYKATKVKAAIKLYSKKITTLDWK